MSSFAGPSGRGDATPAALYSKRLLGKRATGKVRLAGFGIFMGTRGFYGTVVETGNFVLGRWWTSSLASLRATRDSL